MWDVKHYHRIKVSALGLGIIAFTFSCASFRNGDAPISDSLSATEHDAMAVNQKLMPSTEDLQATATYHFAMAQAHSAAGQSERAIESYRLALSHDPESGLLYSRLASEWLKLGQFSSAISTCEEGLKKAPNSTDILSVRGLVYSQTQEFDAAARDFKRAHEIDPKQESFALLYGEALVEAKRASEAIKFLEKFVKSPTSTFASHYMLGRIYERTREYKRAEAAYLQCLKEKPFWELGVLALAQVYERTGKTERAIQVLTDGFDENQDLSSAQFLALLLLKAEKFREAIPYLEHLRANDSTDLNSMIKLALVYMELKQYPKAENLLKDVLTKSPDSDRVRYYLANIYEEQNQLELAVENYLAVIPSSKLYSESLLRAAQIRAAQRNYQAALGILAPVLQSKDATSGVYVWSSHLYREIGQTLQARNVVEKAYGLYPHDDEVAYLYGQLLDQTGERMAAIKVVERMLERNPSHVEALNFVGYSYLEANIHRRRAGDLLQKAHQLSPENPYVLDSLGFYFFKEGKTEKAVHFLEKSAQKLADEPAVLEHLADAYLAFHALEKAQHVYARLEKKTDDSERKAYYLERLADIKSRLLRSEPKRSIASDSKKD